MSDSIRLDGNRAVAWANRHPELYWRWWRYESSNRNFALCAYRMPFDVKGYFVFRRLRFLRFSEGLAGAEFVVGAEAERQMQRPLPRGIRYEDAQFVLIRNEDSEFCLVCEDFSFYSLEPEERERARH